MRIVKNFFSSTFKMQSLGLENIEKREIWAEFARVFAAFAVVLVHVNEYAIELYNNPILPRSWWFISSVYCALFLFPVPIFFMLSGMFVLEKKDTYGVFFKKRFAKIFSSFFIWGLVYLWFIQFNPRMDFDFLFIFRAFFEGPLHNVFWFIFVIVGLYLIVPLLRIFVQHAQRKEVLYFLVACFVTAALNPLFEKYFHLKIGFELSAFMGFVGYFVLGHYVRNVRVDKKLLFINLGLMLFGVFWTVFGLNYTLEVKGVLDPYFAWVTTPSLVLSSIASFFVIKFLGQKFQSIKSVFWKKLIVILSQLSFGIYLIHHVINLAFMSGKLGFQLTAISFHITLASPVVALLIFIVSAVIVFIFEKINLARRLFFLFFALFMTMMILERKEYKINIPSDQKEEIQARRNALAGRWMLVTGLQQGKEPFDMRFYHQYLDFREDGQLITTWKGKKSLGSYDLTKNSLYLTLGQGNTNAYMVKAIDAASMTLYEMINSQEQQYRRVGEIFQEYHINPYDFQ